MTGQEFKNAVEAAGYTQKDFAEVMGVFRTTIANQYKSAEVQPYWVYALAGLIAANSTSEIIDIVSKAQKTISINADTKTHKEEITEKQNRN